VGAGTGITVNADDVAIDTSVVARKSDNLSVFAATTSAQLAGVISDETGSGALVFATSPALVTPDLGTPSAATLTNATGLPISTGVSGLGTGVATFLATPSSANLAAALTDETGTASVVFSASPTVTGVLTLNGSGNVPMIVNGPAAGNAYIQFKQNGTSKGYIGWDASSNLVMVNAAGGAVIFSVSNTGTVTLADAANIVANTTTGTKIGTAANQKISVWNATPIVQPTTAVAAATFTANSGTAVNDASTFDGYTMGQVVKALRNFGALA
jgi:hypothetical protein